MKTVKQHLVLTVAMIAVTGCTNPIQVDEAGNDAANSGAVPKTHENTDSNHSYSITQGPAKQKGEPLIECPDVKGWRVTAVGTITDTSGKVWTTPADVAYTTGPKATDLYNECNDVTLDKAEELDLNSVPVIEVDADGEVFTTYFFGDNYAEIYVNGKLIGVDPVPYWPFNTAAVRYRVKRPFTLAAKLVDWEENLSLGSEVMHGVPFHNGDGGFTAITKDADGKVVDLTDDSWRTQIFYCSPLLDPSAIVEAGPNQSVVRNSLSCKSPEKANAEQGYAVRWTVPKDWATKDFNDAQWPQATIYTNEQIGSSLDRPAYSNFASLFDDPESDAQFIWSSNLLLDNLVLARKVVE